MKTFVLKISLLSFLILVSGLLIILYNPPKKAVNDDYMAAIVDKHKRLESITPPRLIFVGDSNLAFGMDSERIEKDIGIPTVNMSLHAGLGMPFMVKEVEQSLRKGDIVVLSFDYDRDYLLTGDPKLRTHTVSTFATAIQYLDSPLDSARIVLDRMKTVSTFPTAI